MKYQDVAISEFLHPREERFGPKDKRILGLRRIEKIDFTGIIVLSEKPSNTDMIIVKKGDLVISGINVAKGALAIYDGREDVTATIHYSSYEFDKKKINIDYLKWFLKSPAFVNLIKEQVPGGIKTEIKPKHLLPLRIRLPLWEDQIILAEQFENTGKEFAQLGKEIESQQSLLKKLRQQILQDAVQGKLLPQNKSDEPASELLKRIKAEKEKLIADGKLRKEKPLPPIKEEAIPFEIPKNWAWCRLGEIIEIQSNLVSPFDYPNLPHIAPDNIEKNTGCLLHYNTVKDDNVQSANHYFYSKQLIYSKVRPKLNKVIEVNFDGLCSADMYPIKAFINSKYLLHAMLSKYFLLEVDKYDNRVKMPKINQDQLSSIAFPLPPLAEQQRIVAKVEQLLQHCKELEKTIEQNQKYAEQLQQAVLQEAFTHKN